MIRRLIILLLIVGCVFGDTIIYKSSLFITEYKYKVHYLDVSKDVVYFQDSNGKSDSIKCKLIKKIIDSNGEELDFDCRKNDFGTSESENIKSFPIPTTSSISIGNGILYGGYFGISYNYFIDNNIALLAGFGKNEYYYDCSLYITGANNSIKSKCHSKTIESTFFGCRYFFYTFYDKIRPIISLTYGMIGLSFYDAYSQGNKPTQDEGMRFGVGIQWMGKKKKFGFDAEIHKNVTGHTTAYNGWNISYSLKYAF